MSLYYQYGTAPTAMQTPDYQTFLKLLEQMRQQNGGDASGSGAQQAGQGMKGIGQLMKMFSSPGQPSGTQWAAFNAGAGPVSAAGADDFFSAGGGAGIAGLGF